jgi:hypothetical protein
MIPLRMNKRVKEAFRPGRNLENDEQLTRVENRIDVPHTIPMAESEVMRS